uniref:Uncharacterized protein n=1 Tax=uncultured Elusimicrobia bacterium TaxID=699876 RepID=A0A650EMU4_9BACT|nr:hypothetical protein Elusimicrob1349_1010 [uncultured Elusimicrobia bacterium]
MTAYKRDFGVKNRAEEKSAPTVTPAGFCPSCGKMGFAALRVMVTPPDGGAPFTVCFKKQCVHCGFIPEFKGKDKNGAERVYPLFFMPFNTRPGISVKYRDFYFPPELYQTEDGKADVALKARLAAALVRLAQNEPRRSCFDWEELKGNLTRTDKNSII